MSEPAFVDILRDAENGLARFPENGAKGAAAIRRRLDTAMHMLFADAGLDAAFRQQTDVPADSPFAPRAARLRLLRANREALQAAFTGNNPLAGALYQTLATGPGPTAAKRAFAESLTTPAAIDAASSLRRSLSEKAYAVYREERDWLKQVGPSREKKRAGILSRLKSGNLALTIAVLAGAAILVVAAVAGGAPLTAIIVPAIIGIRLLRAK